MFREHPNRFASILPEPTSILAPNHPSANLPAYLKVGQFRILTTCKVTASAYALQRRECDTPDRVLNDGCSLRDFYGKLQLR